MKPTTKVPGAGAYDPEPKNTMQKLPAFSMKIKLAGDLEQQTKSRVPGPGTYESNLNDKPSPAKFGFGTGTRDNVSPKKQNMSPGPGHYKINATIGDVPAYAMPNRPEEYKYI